MRPVEERSQKPARRPAGADAGCGIRSVVVVERHFAHHQFAYGRFRDDRLPRRTSFEQSAVHPAGSRFALRSNPPIAQSGLVHRTAEAGHLRARRQGQFRTEPARQTGHPDGTVASRQNDR